MLRSFAAPVVALTFLLAPATAQAAWMRAESRHYIVYGEGDAAAVRNKAEQLEKLNLLQRSLAGTGDKLSALKPRVYLLGSAERVRATVPFRGNFASGYFGASVRGPYAVTTAADDKLARFPAQLVLFHELTHHFMSQASTAAYPVWYSEGVADFVGTASIDGNVITLGSPVDNRYFCLRGRRGEDWIAIEKLLTAHDYAAVGDRLDLLYAEGWLLTHYLTLGGTRQGQLAAYLTAINSGRSYRQAAQVFGDLGQLNRELKAYAERNKLPVKVITFKPVDPGLITVSPVSPAQTALMMADIRIDAGIPASDADRFAASVRKIAAIFPDDSWALRIKVEADWLAGEREDRAASLAQWAMLAPRDPVMLHQRALLAMDALVADKVTANTRWEAVRSDLLAALRLAPNDPAILKSYYDSYAMQGVEPTPGAQNGLFRALDLVPQDVEVRYALAAGFERRGLFKDAMAVIAPAAYEIDEGKTDARDEDRAAKVRTRFRLARQSLHETARTMLTRLEKEAHQPAGIGPP